MQRAGYKDFERGVKGSTAENLTVLEYKIQQDQKRVDELTTQITEQESSLEEVKQEITAIKPIKAGFDEISFIGKKKLLSSKIEMSSDEYDKLQNLAKEGLAAQITIAQQIRQMNELRWKIVKLNEQFDKVYDSTAEFRKAIKLAPERVRELFSEIFQKDKESRERKQNQWRVRFGERNPR